MRMRAFVTAFVLSVAFLVGASAGGAAGTLAPGDYEFSIVFDGRQRSYELHVPQGEDGQAAPLVLDFHGLGSNSSQQRLISGFRRLSEQKGFIVAWPQGWGLIPSWNADTCCGVALLSQLDDVGLAVAIVNDIAKRTDVDLNRVYATGLSNGGALSHHLACRAADVFAAVAPVSFPLPERSKKSCRPVRPVAVMHFHGFNDTVVPYWTPSIAALRSAPQSFRAWREIDGCSDDPHISYWKGFSYCQTCQECSQNAEVTLCSLSGGHILYVNLSGVEIAEMAWDFFTRFSLERDEVTP